MRVAVTGSSGLIGSALVRSLRDDGHEAVPVVRRGRPKPPGPSIVWDLDARTIDAAGFERVDAVVHLAGEPFGARRLTPPRKRAIHESRVVGTTLLAETLAGLHGGPRLLLSQSGTNYYGDRGEEVLTESAGRGGSSFFADLCVAWEAATKPAADAGIRTIITRTGFVLDREGGSLPKLVLNTKLGVGGRIGNGKQWMSWISLDDEIRAMRFLLETDGLFGPYNLSAPTPVRNREFSSTLGRVLHRPTFIPIPKFGPALVLGRELAQELLFGSFRVVPAALEAAGFQFRHRDIETAMRAVLGRPS